MVRRDYDNKYISYGLKALPGIRLLFLLVVLASCTAGGSYPPSVRAALEQAGDNRDELLKVLEHYSHHPKDSLKLRSAYFLIGHMPGHGWGARAHPELFDPVFAAAAAIPGRAAREAFFIRRMDSLRRARPAAYYEDRVVADLRRVTAAFLIDNIELAFEAWRRLPPPHRSDFDVFLAYVLPYRAAYEPLEAGNRRKQYQKYQWVYERLRAGRPLRAVIRSVLDSTGLGLYHYKGFPGRLSGRRLEQTGFGLCGDLVNYSVNALRAIGIPVANDYTPHWGNRYGLGHNWLAFPWPRPDSIWAVELPGRRTLNLKYRYASLSKAYRHVYARTEELYPHAKDVTAVYRGPNRITISNRWGHPPKGRDVLLWVFDKSDTWQAVDQAQSVTDEAAVFTDLCPRVVFLRLARPGRAAPGCQLSVYH